MGCIFDARPLRAEPPPYRCPPRLVAVLESPPCAFDCRLQLAHSPPTRTLSLPSPRCPSSLARTYLPPTPTCAFGCCHQCCRLQCCHPSPPRTRSIASVMSGPPQLEWCEYGRQARAYSPPARTSSLASAQSASQLERAWTPPLARTLRVTLQALVDQHCQLAPHCQPASRANVRGRGLGCEMHGGRCCDDRRGWSCSSSSYSFCGSDGCMCDGSRCDDHCENAKSYWAMSDEANDCSSEMKMSDPC